MRSCQSIWKKNKGHLKEGYDGDLTLVDLENRRIIQDSDTWTKVGWTPYEGMELTGWPMYTIVDGMYYRREPEGPLRGKLFLSRVVLGES